MASIKEGLGNARKVPGKYQEFLTEKYQESTETKSRKKGNYRDLEQFNLLSTLGGLDPIGIQVSS